MATRLRSGATTWSMSRDDEGHRTYKITFRVVSDTKLDGPAVVLNTPGLPRPGQAWSWDNDVDLWAWCRPTMEITPDLEGEPNKTWKVTCTFSTKPPDRQKCQDQKIEDPILEPQRVSGSFVSFTKEAVTDRFGRPVTTSSWELFRGPQVEFDFRNPQIKVEQNVINLNLPLCAGMVNKVNDRTLWGMPRRTIKLSDFSWEKKYHGLCYPYYTRTFTFDVDSETFDRELLDEGTKVLRGRWNEEGEWELIQINGADPDPFNPEHFEQFKDRNGENCRVILNGRGRPAGVVVADGSYFISASAPSAIFNQGRPLKESVSWLPFVDFYDPNDPLADPIPEWNENVSYVRGNVVTEAGDPSIKYVCLKAIAADPVNNFTPSLDREFIAGDGGSWRMVTGNLTNRGLYDASVNYDEGDYVYSGNSQTTAGKIRFEYYGEANFLLLGIPTVF